MNPEERELGLYFDARAREGLFVAFDAEESERVRFFLHEWKIAKGQRILEPGCGQGRLTALLAEAVGAAGEVFALDVSAEMIQLAVARKLPPQVRFAAQSVYALPQPDGYFDQVVCFNVFPHFLRPGQALVEMARVLAPGGNLWICHADPREKLNSFHRNASAPVARKELPDEPLMREWIQAAGLCVAQIADGPETGYLLRADKPHPT